MSDQQNRTRLAHPLRWRTNKPNASALVALSEKERFKDGVTMDGLQAFTQRFFAFYNDALMKLPFEQRPENSRDIQRQITLAELVSTFWSSFRNIYQLEDSLFEMLRLSEAGSIPVDAVNWPHRFCYIAFPPGNGIEFGDADHEVDGVYLDMRAPGHLAFTVCGRPTSERLAKIRWPGRLEPHQWYGFEIKPGESLNQLLSQNFRAEIEALEGAEDFDANDIEEFIEETGLQVRSVKKQADKQDIARLERLFNPTYQACSIAVNAICFLNTQELEQKEWPADAPQKLVTAATTGTPRQRQNATSELTRLSFLPVHHLRMPAAGVTSSDGLKRTNASHWRRGHFRMVAIGKGRAERSIRWIRPVLVNADKAEPSKRVQVHQADKKLH